MIIYASVCNKKASAPNDSKRQFHKDRMLLIMNKMFRNEPYVRTFSYGREYHVSDYYEIPYFDKLSETKERPMRVGDLMKMQNDIKFASVSDDESNLISRLFGIFEGRVIKDVRKSGVFSVSDLLEALKQKLGCNLFELVDFNTINELNNMADKIAECDAIECELQDVIKLAEYNQKKIFYSSKGPMNEQIPDDIFKLFNAVDLQEFREFSTHMYWDFHGDKVEDIQDKLNQIRKRIDDCMSNAGMLDFTNYKIKVYEKLYKYVMFSNVVVSANKKLEQIDAIRIFLRETNAIISGTAGAGIRVIDIIGGFMLNLWGRDSFDLDINENDFNNEELKSIYKLVYRLLTYRESGSESYRYSHFHVKLIASRDVIEKNKDIFLVKPEYKVEYKKSDSKSYDRDKLKLKSEIIALRRNLSVSSNEFMQLLSKNNISLIKEEIIDLRRNIQIYSNEFMQLLSKNNISLTKEEIIDLRRNTQIYSNEFMQLISKNNISLTKEEIMDLRRNFSVSSEEFAQLLLNNKISLDENSIMKRIADMGLYNGGIWSAIMSGELNCTKDQLIEIIESNKLDGCYIWSLIISDKFRFDRYEVMKIIRDGKLADNYIWSLIMWRKVHFLENDINEIINLNIFKDNQMKILMNKFKNSIMKRIADMGLYGDDVVGFILSGEFNVDKLDIMDLIWDGKLYGYNIVKLLISGKFDFTKDEIIGMIDDNMFLGSEIELIKLNMFDFTKDEIIRMINGDKFFSQGSELFKLIKSNVFNFTKNEIIEMINGRIFDCYEIVELIKSKVFDFTKNEIIEIFNINGRILYCGQIVELIKSKEFDFTKNEIIEMINGGIFWSTQVVRLIKSGIFDFTKDEINDMIDRNMFSDGEIEILLENDYFNNLNVRNDELEVQSGETDLDDSKTDFQSEVNIIEPSNKVSLNGSNVVPRDESFDKVLIIDISRMSECESVCLFQSLMIIMNLFFENNKKSFNAVSRDESFDKVLIIDISRMSEEELCWLLQLLMIIMNLFFENNKESIDNCKNSFNSIEVSA